jgi:hypothetical protein
MKENLDRSKPLTNDTASFDQRYYDVALLPDGEAAIIWLDNSRQLPKKDRLFFRKNRW